MLWLVEGAQVLAATTSAEVARDDGTTSSKLNSVRTTERSMRSVWRASLCLLGLQLVGMFVLSTLQYNRFNLTNDFAVLLAGLDSYRSRPSEPDYQFLGLFLLA